MSEIEAAATRHRAALLTGERETASAMVREYGAAYRAIQSQSTTLVAQIEAARAAGEAVDPLWLLKQDRLAILLRQTEGELARFARSSGERIQGGVAASARSGAADAAELLHLAHPGVQTTFARLPTAAVEELAGVLSEGSPVRALLDDLAPQGSAAVRSALITGVATGQGVAQIGEAVRDGLRVPLTRALTIARTETMRAYRESTRRTYLANGDVVAGWRWSASLSRRTCAFCIAKHGSVHTLTETMATHPACRCTQTPVLHGEEDAEVLTGERWFERQGEGTQTAILGPAKLAAYKGRVIHLLDLVGERDDPVWGPVGYERSLRDATGGR